MTLASSAFAIAFRMPAGIPGTVSRPEFSRTRAAILSGTAGQTPTAYGLGVVIDSTTGQFRLPVPADQALDGLLVRAFPSLSAAPMNIGNDPIGTSAPLAGIPQDIMEAGYMSVQLFGSGTATPRGKVYCWSGATAGNHVQGGLEATAAYGFATAPKAGGNTGNGTFTVAPAAGSGVPQTGAYTLTMLTATTYSVVGPNGESLPNGTTGVAYATPQIGFTLTAGGTAFVAGDGFTITNTPNTIMLPMDCYWIGAADTNAISEVHFRY
jgi:hypothetical protein